MSNVTKVVRLGVVLMMVTALVFSFGGCTKKDEPKATTPVSGRMKSEFPNLAKISLMDAVNAALAKFPGKVLSVELEEEDGYLVYEVEVVGADGSINEVNVDAGNGVILAMEKEADKKK